MRASDIKVGEQYECHGRVGPVEVVEGPYRYEWDPAPSRVPIVEVWTGLRSIVSVRRIIQPWADVDITTKVLARSQWRGGRVVRLRSLLPSSAYVFRRSSRAGDYYTVTLDEDAMTWLIEKLESTS